MPISLQDFTQGKVLGQGMYGTVYAAEPKNPAKIKEKYVIKMQKVLSTNIMADYENMFAFELGTIYPNIFMTLYDYEYIYDCKFHNTVEDNANGEYNGVDLIQVKKINASSLCIRRLYPYVDYTLTSAPITEPKHIYSLICQFINAYSLLLARGYIYSDMHADNLGIVAVDRDVTVAAFGKTVPTFGMQLKFIDYGGAIHTWIDDRKIDNPMKKHTAKVSSEMSVWMFCAIMRRVNFDYSVLRYDGMDNYRNKFKIPFEPQPYNFRIFADLCLMYDTDTWFKYIYLAPKPDDFSITLLIPDEDIKFIAHNWKKPKAIFSYFHKKLSTAA